MHVSVRHGLVSKNGTFTSEIKEAGYELIHGHREDKRGCGKEILYRNNVNAKPGKASSSKYTSFEFSYLTLISDKSKILLVCVYRKQEISCNIFCDELESFMEGVYHKGDSVICVGDFNVWVDVDDDKDVRKLVTLINAFGLVQLVREPTHKSGHTLNHLYVNPFQMDMKYEVVEGAFYITSDHFPIIIDLPCMEHQQKKQSIRYRNIKDIEMVIKQGTM